MTEILSHVTPLTRGIIWLQGQGSNPNSTYYKWVDYLLDGLLTASLDASDSQTFLLVGKNFGKDFYVFISKLELTRPEVLSFFNLVIPVLGNEDDLLVLDQRDALPELNKIAPKEVLSRFRMIK